MEKSKDSLLYGTWSFRSLCSGSAQAGTYLRANTDNYFLNRSSILRRLITSNYAIEGLIEYLPGISCTLGIIATEISQG